MHEIKVYDQPMCCPTGVCGQSIDPALVEFAGALRTLEKHGVVVKRYNLAQQTEMFTGDQKVRKLFAATGKKGLPFIFVDDELKFSGRYPTSAELSSLFGFDTVSETCCGTDKGCCC